MATKSTKVGKGTLKSASGRGTVDFKKSSAKPSSTSGKTVLIDAKSVSGKGPSVKVSKSQTASVALKPADLKKATGRGGKESVATEAKLSSSSGSIKVKVDGANLKKGLKN